MAHDVFISFKFENQLVVDKIVNQLTNKYGISCWICTEKIRAGENFRKDIADAISAAKIVVLVQSKLSAVSKEVRQEIVDAFDNGKIIMPFIIEPSQLSGVLQSLLKDIHYIDATIPTLDERIYDLAKDICRTLGMPFAEASMIEKENKVRLVSTPNVIPKTIFCGRDDILGEIHNKFQQEERVLFLHGIGGIGKTQIAKQYAKKHKNDYDTIIYATYSGSIQKLILAETPFAIEPTMNRYTLSDGTQEDDETYFGRKLETIQKLSTERTLIILDNYDVDGDENLPLLMNGRYRLLITTRCDFSRYYPTIKINPIDSIDVVKEIFMKNYQGYYVDEDDSALVELMELVNRHTYTIELLAQHMENSGQTPAEMITALRERGITSLDEEVRNSSMKTQIAYENLIKMFNLFGLNEEERQILMYLSLMPTEGVEITDFKEWADLKSLKVLKNLENRSWIVRNTGGIALHPIIKEVIQYELPANEDNCEAFLTRFSKAIPEERVWGAPKREKDKYGNIAKNLLAKFKELTPKTEYLYYTIEVLLSFSVDPECAIELAKRLYDYYIATSGDISYEVGRAAYKIGWAYAYNSQLSNSIDEARKWLEKGDAILSSLELLSTTQISMLTQTKVNLSKIHLLDYEKTSNKNDYLIAQQYAESALKITKGSFPVGDIQYGKVGGAYCQLADVFLAGHEYTKALENINNALEVLVPLYGESSANCTYTFSRYAAILFAVKRYDEAQKNIMKSTLGYVEHFGENHPLVVGMYILWGDCGISLDVHDDAIVAYQKALDIAQNIYAPGAQQIIDIQAKIDKYCK